MNAKKRRVIDNLDKRINEVLIIKKVFIQLQLKKTNVLHQIESALNDAEKENTTKFVIFYAGHGHEEYGGWVTHVPEKGVKVEQDQKMIHIKEILNIIKHSNYEENVEITSDSCHSGMICHQAKKWFESHSNRDDICFKNIFIMASTYKKNKGAWGRYRNFKSTHQK